MTCQEFWGLVGRIAHRPLGEVTTTAERAAIDKHFHSCDECRLTVTVRAVEQLSKKTPDELRQLHDSTMVLVLKDRQDPEFLESVR